MFGVRAQAHVRAVMTTGQGISILCAEDIFGHEILTVTKITFNVYLRPDVPPMIDRASNRFPNLICIGSI